MNSAQNIKLPDFRIRHSSFGSQPRLEASCWCLSRRSGGRRIGFCRPRWPTARMAAGLCDLAMSGPTVPDSSMRPSSYALLLGRHRNGAYTQVKAWSPASGEGIRDHQLWRPATGPTARLRAQPTPGPRLGVPASSKVRTVQGALLTLARPIPNSSGTRCQGVLTAGPGGSPRVAYRPCRSPCLLGVMAEVSQRRREKPWPCSCPIRSGACSNSKRR